MPNACTTKQTGVSLVELIMFIVVVSVGIAGILSVMDVTSRASGDPLQRKQALAIAEALLEEVSLMPFTHCDPDGFDPETQDCVLTESMGNEAGEVRGHAITPFDNVNDYQGFVLNPGDGDIGNSGSVVIPPGYAATVAIQAGDALGPAANPIAGADVLRINVTVTYNGGSDSMTLEGYRTRYDPAGMP